MKKIRKYTGEKDYFLVSVRGVAIEDNKVLLVEEVEEGEWETPGGRVRHGETIENTLKREFLEETGHDIDPLRLLQVYNKHDYIFITFLVKLKDKVKEPLDDIKGVRWFSKKEIRSLLKKNLADDHDIEVFKRFINGELE